MTDMAIPVITIDGPTASGKGTISQEVARQLGWHYLDSGSLYRLTALQAIRDDVDLSRPADLAAVAGSLRPQFGQGRIDLGGEDVSLAIRMEPISQAASRIAVHPEVRSALVELQRSFRRPPGLVADGRDMGTVIFPDAPLKVFLTASVESRAHRRYKQLIEKGISAKLPDLLQDLRERDARDSQRATAPLKPARGAFAIDSTQLAIEDTVQAVLAEARRLGLARD